MGIEASHASHPEIRRAAHFPCSTFYLPPVGSQQPLVVVAERHERSECQLGQSERRRTQREAPAGFGMKARILCGRPTESAATPVEAVAYRLPTTLNF